MQFDIYREREMVEARRFRDMSTSSNHQDRAKTVCGQPRIIRPTFRKVQVVYYLSRNGQLEHPHYMEVTHLANQHLRLKDVLDRLTFLRGKAMPSLYSWSCKRSYKNGYVWNDLSENDVIYPSDGAEYVLKGSEFIEGSTEVENAQQFQLVGIQQNAHEPRSPLMKRKTVVMKRHPSPPEDNTSIQYHEEDEEELEMEEYGEKMSNTTSTTPHSRCSRGVSTDELGQLPPPPPPPPPHAQSSSSPPSTTSSSTLSDKASNNTSKRFEDGDPVRAESILSRNSVLFQLISCGGAMPFRTETSKQEPSIGKKEAQLPAERSTAAARKSSSGGGSNLHKGVLCKAAAERVGATDEENEIMCMSENPRFGKMNVEEKEYFSGSIVEAMATEERVQLEPVLKKSSSYNEERSSKAGVGEGAEEEVKREKSFGKGKCIPGMKCYYYYSAASKQIQ